MGTDHGPVRAGCSAVRESALSVKRREKKSECVRTHMRVCVCKKGTDQRREKIRWKRKEEQRCCAVLCEISVAADMFTTARSLVATLFFFPLLCVRVCRDPFSPFRQHVSIVFFF